MHVYILHVLKLHKCTFLNVFTRFTQKVTLSTFISRYSIVSGKMEWMTKCNDYDYKQEIARYVTVCSVQTVLTCLYLLLVTPFFQTCLRHKMAIDGGDSCRGGLFVCLFDVKSLDKARQLLLRSYHRYLG